MTEVHPYYLIWSGALNMGDTPGVFMDAQFVGLLLQIPVTVTFLPSGSGPVELLLMTTEVEILEGKKHPVYWDWSPGRRYRRRSATLTMLTLFRASRSITVCR